MKKLACLFSLLFCFCVSGQNVPVLAKPSGLLVTPPDFFTVNSNAIRVIASGITNGMSFSSTNAVSKITSNSTDIVSPATTLNFVAGTNLAIIDSGSGVATVVIPTNTVTIDTNIVAEKSWVRSLLSFGGIHYNSTNLNPSGFDTTTYAFVDTIPAPAVRTYSGMTNGQYIGSVMTTNAFSSLSAPVTVSMYLSKGTAGSISVHPEIYYTYDKTNLLGDWEAASQIITTGTNLYQWVISFPSVTPTNGSGFYIVRRLKVDSVGASPALSLWVGTNTPGNILVQTPSSVSGSGTVTNVSVRAGSGILIFGPTSITSGGTNTIAVNTAFVMPKTGGVFSAIVDAGSTGSFPIQVGAYDGSSAWSSYVSGKPNCIGLVTNVALSGKPRIRFWTTPGTVWDAADLNEYDTMTHYGTLICGTNVIVTNNITFRVSTNTAGTNLVFYIDMSKAMHELRITNSASLTFHTTNRAAGLTTMLRIKQTSAASLGMSFNSGWTNFVGSPPPTALSSNVWAVLSLSCWGGDETNVLAGYAVQPY